MSGKVTELSTKPPRLVEWGAWVARQKGIELGTIAKDAGVTDRQVIRWVRHCERALENVPEYDAAQAYMQSLGRPSMQCVTGEIAKGNWRVAVKVLEGIGLLNPNVGEGGFGALSDDTLIAEMIELAVESKDKTVIARIKRVTVGPGNLRSLDSPEDQQPLDGAEAPEA